MEYRSQNYKYKYGDAKVMIMSCGCEPPTVSNQPVKTIPVEKSETSYHCMAEDNWKIKI